MSATERGVLKGMQLPPLKRFLESDAIFVHCVILLFYSTYDHRWKLYVDTWSKWFAIAMISLLKLFQPLRKDF